MMPNGATAYVVVRREDGFGDVCALAAGQRYTLGRATTNRIVLAMGQTCDIQELVAVVLDGLLEETPADVGAILSVKEGQKLELLNHRQREPSARGYRPVSEYVSNEVLGSHEAILAVDIAG